MAEGKLPFLPSQEEEEAWDRHVGRYGVREWVCRQVGHDLDELPAPQINVGICASCGSLMRVYAGPLRFVQGRTVTEVIPVQKFSPHASRMQGAEDRA